MKSRPTHLTINSFPSTREEAERIAQRIRSQAILMGCTCHDPKVEFIQTPLGEKSARVEHDLTCRFGHRMS